MHKISLAALIVILTAIPAFSGADPFDRIDADHNQKIDKREYRDAAQKLFDRLDKNKDGYLDAKEFKKLGIPDGEKVFREWDADKNGQLSRDEFVSGIMKQYRYLDRNNDGFIDREELNLRRNEEGPRKNELMTTPFVLFRF